MPAREEAESLKVRRAELQDSGWCDKKERSLIISSVMEIARARDSCSGRPSGNEKSKALPLTSNAC